jgi:hypothetical protein
MKVSLKDKVWWSYLGEDLQELLEQSVILVKTVEKWGGNLPNGRKEFHDFSFVVFPAAKAYEGFLKKLFLDLGFISETEYLGKRFRVGKALNPALDKRYRAQEGVYDKLVDYCDGKQLADSLWEAWRSGRNLLFHWFPKEKNAINFEESKERVKMIISTIDRAFKECKVDRS